MRLFFIILLLAFMPGVTAAEHPGPQSVAAEVAAAARQEALEKILSERDSPEAFARALAAARDAGVGAQAMLEARFLYQVDRGDDDSLAAMLPDLLRQREVFRLEDSAIFSVEEEWLAVVEYVRAVAALRKGDGKAFKEHITEAFWLNPGQAAAFAPHIEGLRMREAMASIRVDFSLRPAPLDGGEAVELAALMKGKKAMLLHFWSPWSRECADAMPDFITSAGKLTASGVAVVSLVPEGMPGLLEEAAIMARSHRDKASGAWLVDPKGGPLARQLRVRKFPTMVIVSTDGKILFNGDAAEDAFWQTLRDIDPRIVRPASGGGELR